MVGQARAYIAVADHVDGRVSEPIPVDLLGPDLGLIYIRIADADRIGTGLS